MQSFIPNPLHPAVVHLPVAFAVILPFFALGAIWFIRRGSRPRAAWGVTVGMVAALFASGWVALQTGEQQEERVEDVVSEAAIHGHEEAAELFIAVSAGVLVLALGGFAPGRLGRVSRWVTAAGTIAVLGAGWNVGHSGGMLVYRDGAAGAYANANGQRGENAGPRGSGDERDERDERGGTRD